MVFLIPGYNIIDGMSVDYMDSTLLGVYRLLIHLACIANNSCYPQ